MAQRPKPDLTVLEQHVLLAMLRLHPLAYGITIQQEIAERTSRVPSLGSVYAALDRLEQNGFAASRQG